LEEVRMSSLIVEPTAKAAWYRVVIEAKQRASCELDEATESYLVFLLMRYLQRPDLVRSVLALRFLRASQDTGRSRSDAMQDVGDQCLIYAGLFPEQAHRRRVRVTYFIDLGRAAYDAVADGTTRGYARLYSDLAEAFVPLTDVLRALRGDEARPLHDALLAAEHWAETGSPAALRELGRYTDSLPVTNPPRRPQ
jgi:hypothetical protein